MMVSVKVCEKVPLKALTVTVPEVVPAVTVILAWPLASVRAKSAERVAPPLTRKLTGTFDSGWPLVPMTCTTSGAPKLCPDWVVCRSPETFVMDATRTTVDKLKVAEMPLLVPVRAALTVIGPAAAGEKVTMVCAWPTAWVAETAELTVAWPAGETIHCTFVLAIVIKAESVWGGVQAGRKGRRTEGREGSGQRLAGEVLIEFDGVQTADQHADGSGTWRRTEDRGAGGIAVGIGKDTAGLRAGTGSATGGRRIGIEYYLSAGRRYLGTLEAHGNVGHGQSVGVDVNLDRTGAGGAGKARQRSSNRRSNLLRNTDKLDAVSGEAYGFRKIDTDAIHRRADDVLHKRSRDGTNLCGPRI